MPDVDAGEGGHAATDGSGAVQVAIDDTGRSVRVVPRPAWRAEVGVEGLGVAALEAFDAARITHRSEQPPGAGGSPDPVQPRRLAGSPDEQLATIRRAWCELDEFGAALAMLSEQPIAVGMRQGRVLARVSAAAVVALELERPWPERADDADLAFHLGSGCPDLVAVAAASAVPLPLGLTLPFTSPLPSALPAVETGEPT